eukprot:TRINITY_DN5595_c0_g1_i1.p1 TRINITY_DN5595_c0_g1~~TRINITY_DN5595_c0_g1_i1.p1  ORF type:complete len:536 (-),score=78.64 TRINITY_DN5595_c0_g1_i1:59-1666(-)
MKQINWDDLLGYNTAKLVRIQDRRLGLLNYAATLGVLIYLFYFVLYDQGGYNQWDTATGSVAAYLDNPNSSIATGSLSYCLSNCSQFNGDEPGCNCVVWDAADMVYPETQDLSLFVTTRVIETRQVKNNSPCVDGECGSPWITVNVSEPMYIVAPDLYMLDISSDAFAPDFLQQELARQSGPTLHSEDTIWSKQSSRLWGQLISYNGDILYTSEVNETDRFSLGLLLKAANVEIEKIHTYGSIVRVFVTYGNCKDYVKRQDEAKKKRCEETRDKEGPLNYYFYQPEWLPDTTYAAQRVIYSVDGSERLIRSSTGIKLNFRVTGMQGQFSLGQLLISLVSVYVLFSAATFVIDSLVIWLIPGSRLYRQAKYERTQNFSAMRSNILKEQNLKKKITNVTKLARFGDFEEVNMILERMKNHTTDLDRDQIILSCIEVYAMELLDMGRAEGLSQMLSCDESRVKAFIVTEQLKDAYLLAAQTNRVDLVKAVLAAAKSEGNARVQSLCEKFISAKKRTNSSPNILDIPVDMQVGQELDEL